MDKIRHIITPLTPRKKVNLHDLAAPKPSRAANRALNGALIRAHQDQKSISRLAEKIRTS